METKPIFTESPVPVRAVGILKRDGHNIQIFVSEDITDAINIDILKSEVYNKCWMKLQRIQPASCSHALKYEGYSIEVTP